jgi:hypothetical protein
VRSTRVRRRSEGPCASSPRIGSELPAHTIVHVHESDHGGWSYWTLVGDVAERFPIPAEFHWETADARWVRVDELTQLELFDAFAATLTELGLTG